MNQKEIACFRGGTRKQAKETGAVCRQSTTSEKYHTINIAVSQTGAISHLLLCGAENAISRHDLIAKHLDKLLKQLSKRRCYCD